MSYLDIGSFHQHAQQKNNKLSYLNPVSTGHPDLTSQYIVLELQKFWSAQTTTVVLTVYYAS